MKLLHVVGARPNFPKLAPVHRVARERNHSQLIVHTGQHYDEALSENFFKILDIPKPDFNLEVGSGSHAVQTARVMERIEPILVEQRPDWVVVYGDVNSTLAASLVAAKLGVRIAHVEAGLRSYDRAMPEEINRLVVDRLADLLLTPSKDAAEILTTEGEAAHKIVFVGNVMIDTLYRNLPMARAARRSSHGISVQGRIIVVTLHRPSNVDNVSRLGCIATALREIATTHTVLFPLHPRTRQRILACGVGLGDVHLLDPLGYLEMVGLLDEADAVITDSGGIQEETTALGVKCFTVRENTERPITITEGTNTLVPDPALLPSLLKNITKSETTRRPEGWDGNTAARILDALTNYQSK